jgi:K+-sensing histidine kinase KdpD
VDILKRGFFSNLIAAVNEPLLAVVGTLQSVTNSLDSSRTLGVEVDKSTHNQLTERMNFALSETTRLSELIADYQQIELFRQQLVSSGSESISLSTVVARTISDDLLMIRRLPQLNFSFDVPDTLPQLRVDADLLRRAISALVKYAARGASQGGISLQASINTQGWMVLAITGTAFEKAGAPTESLLDESRQFLTRLATEHGRNDNSATLIPIVMARMIVEFYGGRIDASPDEKAYPGFVIYLPTAL